MNFEINKEFYIIDATSNHPGITFVFDESGQTIHTEENCICFKTQKEAQDLIDKKGWDWAGIMEL